MRIRRMWIPLAGLLLFAASCAVFAAGPGAVRKQVEGSMLVTGRVTIEQDGSVSGWTIDQREALPTGVSGLVDRVAPQWQFEPVLVDGQPVRGNARMSLRVAAKRLDDGNYEVWIRDGYFGRDALSPEERVAGALRDEYVSAVEMRPPSYPMRALEVNAQGTVYLVLRVDRQGRVADAIVEQVNLRTIGSETQMRQMRDMLAKPALARAREWQFNIPTAGEWKDDDSWSLRVPVDFFIADRRDAGRQVGYGQWDTYVPGPRAPVPWETGDAASISPDTLIAGEVHQAGASRKLLTPLGG